MKCNHMNIMLYWSRELSGKQHEEMDQHLKTCEECRKMLVELETLEQEFQALPLLTSDKDLLQAAIEKQKTSEKRFWFLPFPAVRWATAMVVLLALVFLYVLMHRPEQPSINQGNSGVPLASYSDKSLDDQMSSLQEKVSSLKERMQGSKSKSIRFARNATIRRTFVEVRSDVDELKTMLTESGHFPFQNTFIQQRRKHYENNTFYHFKHYNDHYSLSFFNADVC